MSREHSKQIKKRFIDAVSAAAKAGYPDIKEIDVIRSTGMNPVNYYKMRVTEGRYPTLDNCALLCEQYGFSGSWLLNGKGPMKLSRKTQTDPMEMLKIATKELELKLKSAK